MPISYRKFFDLMKERGLTTYRIRKENIISEGTLQKMRKDGYVSTETLERLCEALDCQPGDLMEYYPEGGSPPSLRQGAEKPKKDSGYDEAAKHLEAHNIDPKSVIELIEIIRGKR